MKIRDFSESPALPNPCYPFHPGDSASPSFYSALGPHLCRLILAKSQPSRQPLLRGGQEDAECLYPWAPYSMAARAHGRPRDGVAKCVVLKPDLGHLWLGDLGMLSQFSEVQFHPCRMRFCVDQWGSTKCAHSDQCLAWGHLPPQVHGEVVTRGCGVQTDFHKLKNKPTV